MVKAMPAPVSERERGRFSRSLSSTPGSKCPAKRIEPRKKNGLWNMHTSVWDCHLYGDHTGPHDAGGGHRKFTDADIEDYLRIKKRWERLDCPQPPATVDETKEFIAYVLTLKEVAGPPIHAIRTLDELYEVRDLYLGFSHFAFDVETHAGRPVRMLQAGTRVLSRYGEGTTPCLACGKPIPSKRRAYCSADCRKAADKDKPALDTRTNKVWCLSLAGPGVSHVIPMGHPSKRKQLDHTEVFGALKPLFLSDRTKINQNVGFDLLSIAKYYDKVLPPPPYVDTMTMVFLLNENLADHHDCDGAGYNLGHLAEHYIGYKYAEKLGEEAYSVAWRRAMRYSIVDAKMAWMLWWKLHERLEGTPKLNDLFKLEMEVLRVLLSMRQQGAYVDIQGFKDLRPKLEAQRDQLIEEIATLAGRPIGDRPGELNLNSPKQVGDWLYDDLGLHCTVYTNSGQRGTSAPVIKALAKRREEPRKILEYKDVNKLLTTYIVGFIPTIDDDSRIRASFNQAVARTGRLSCSAPNLQNIPARWKEINEGGTMIRRLFTAPPGRVLIVADYSQIELRILAHQTKDRLLMYAYTHGLDLHTQTASLIYKVPQDQVTAEQRAIAKNSNFNFAFEGGPMRVVEMSGISVRAAEAVWDGWHKAYPGVKKWGAATKRFCLQNGYVETLYGRKRRLPDIASRDPKTRSGAERQAVNHPIQGTAADIAKVAILRVHEALREFHAALVLQIHDEFVIECDASEAHDAIAFIRTAMEDIRLGDRPVLDVPLEVSIGVGENWSAAK